MTISTERLRERISHLQERLKGMRQHKYPADCPNAAEYLESLKAEKQQDIDLLTELLAVREAQPVGVYQVSVLKNEDQCVMVSLSESDRIGFTEGGANLLDGYAFAYTAPPTPAAPTEGQLLAFAERHRLKLDKDWLLQIWEDAISLAAAPTPTK